MTGQNGQNTFINCTFDGYYNEDTKTFARGHNINIKNDKQYTSAVISFLNCTCQAADYGIFIEWAENVTIDNCWFENLGVAITVKSSIVDVNNDVPCKSIYIINNRFANAAGFGSLDAPYNIKKGQCVHVSKSFVTVNNNFVLVTDPSGQNFDDESSFILAYNNTIGGVSANNNDFQVEKLGKTFGIMQVIDISSNNSINCSVHKLLFVNGSIYPVTIINSSICAGEHLTIRANKNNLSFSNVGNIFFTTNNGTNGFTLYKNEIATFIKIDNIVGPYHGTFQLVSIMRHVN